MNEIDMSIWDRYVPGHLAGRPPGIEEEDWRWQLRCGRDMILRSRAEAEFIPEHKRRAMEALEVARAAVRERQRLAAEEKAAEAARLEALRWRFPAGLDLHLKGLAAQEASGIGHFVVVTDHIDFQGYCYLQLVKYEHAREVGELLGPNPTFARLFGISSFYFKAWNILMAYGCEKVDDAKHHVGYGVDGPTFYEVLMVCVQRKNDHLVFSKGSLGKLAEDTCRHSDYGGLLARSDFMVDVGDTVGGGVFSRGFVQASVLKDPDGAIFAYPGDSLGITDNVSYFAPGCDLLITRLASQEDEEGGGGRSGRRITANVPGKPGVDWSILVLDTLGDDVYYGWSVNGSSQSYVGERVWLAFQKDLMLELSVSETCASLALRVLRLDGNEGRHLSGKSLRLLDEFGHVVTEVFRKGGGREGVVIPLPNELESVVGEDTGDAG